MENKHIRITSAAELDALVGQHITHEEPETFWEDAHGQFQFDTEEEARRALTDPYYQMFLPDVDWRRTLVREIQIYRPYCADPCLIWLVVEKASASGGSLLVWKEAGRWLAAFGFHPPAEARRSSVAICLAALQSCGFTLEVNHDRIDTQLTQFALQLLQDPAGQNA